MSEKVVSGNHLIPLLWKPKLVHGERTDLHRVWPITVREIGFRNDPNRFLLHGIRDGVYKVDRILNVLISKTGQWWLKLLKKKNTKRSIIDSLRIMETKIIVIIIIARVLCR